jgi:arylsulfatase A-like enzyme
MPRHVAAAFLAALGLFLCAVSRPARAADPAPARPNIVFILADDLGYGDLGCYGQKLILTPNIDALAAGGMRFTQFYAGSPVCAPSRCTLLTGLHSGHAVVRDNRELKPEGQFPLPPGTVTLGHVLKSAGYTTSAIGKWGLGGPGSTGEPGKMGFDHFFGYLCQRIAHSYYPEYLWRDTNKVVLGKNADGQRGAYTHDLLATDALAFIDSAPADRPFFLYLPFTIPHFDLDVPDDSMDAYKGQWDEPNLPMGSYRAQPKPRAAYAGMISRMDRDVGRLMNALKRRGLDQNTLVIFTSDNGPTLLKGLDVKFFNSAAGLRGLKEDVYEGGIRVPFLARWPGKIAPGTTADLPAAFWDVMPTLADLAGARPPEHIDGFSFAPTLLGQPGQKSHEYLYWEFPAKIGQQAVRLGDWKGVRTRTHAKPSGPIELYDLKSDPAESKNVAAEHPDVVARITEVMRTGRAESAEFPLYNPRKATQPAR